MRHISWRLMDMLRDQYAVDPLFITFSISRFRCTCRSFLIAEAYAPPRPVGIRGCPSDQSSKGMGQITNRIAY